MTNIYYEISFYLLTYYLAIHLYTCLFCQKLMYLRIPMPLSGEGNGTPLQYFCLENPMDGGA